METKNYIGMLKNKNRAPIYEAMRQSLCYYLFSNNVPCSIITSVMQKSRSNTYFNIKQAKDKLEVGDKIMQNAYEEISFHKIRIVPCTAEGSVLSRHVGYKMLIDNEIY